MSDEKSQLLATLAPILDHLSTVDPAGGRATADSLDAAFPVDGELLSQVRAEVVAGLQAGWLTPREGGGVRYGRLSKAVDGSRGFSIDAVDMSGPGPGHTHPNGEIDLCFALGGSPGLSGLVFHLQVLTDESAGLLGSWNASLVETVLVQ